MTSSLPKVGRVDPALVGSEARAALRRTPSFGDIDRALAAALDPEESPRPRRKLKETPTRQSIEAVRLAEEETRIASLLGGLPEEVSQARRLGELESGTFETSSALPPSSDSNDEVYAQEMERALAVGAALVSELADADPYGGLIPVEDDDPFAALEPVDGSVDDVDDLALAEQSFAATAAASREVSRVARLPAKQVPRVLVGPKDISKLPMDPRAAFILSHVDGFHSVEEIIDMCSMPESQALELIDRLHDLGVIAID